MVQYLYWQEAEPWVRLAHLLLLDTWRPWRLALSNEDNSLELD